jgi:hypothetical protein
VSAQAAGRAATSTIGDVESWSQGRGGVWTRRVFITLLAVFVAAGLAGFLGVRTSTDSTTEDGWTLTLQHAAIARAGLDVPWQVTIDHPDGFGKELTIAVTGDYFDIFETQGFNPEPSEETRDGDTRYLTFTAPPGDTFTVAYDAYIQPSAQSGRSGTVAVMVDGRRVSELDFRTRVLP